MFKKLIFSVFAVCLLFFTGCRDADSFSSETEDVISESGILELISPVKAGPDTRANTYFLTVKFDAEAEKLISYSLSSELLSLIGMSAGELDDYLKENMGSLYNLNEGPVTRGEHADCITKCYKDFTKADGTKIKGRGSCKAGCWVDSAVKVIEKVADAVL